MNIKKVGLASDHAGFGLKEIIKEYLNEKGIAYQDFGTHSEARMVTGESNFLNIHDNLLC